MNKKKMKLKQLKFKCRRNTLELMLIEPKGHTSEKNLKVNKNKINFSLKSLKII
jgi:hypothetical protein